MKRVASFRRELKIFGRRPAHYFFPTETCPERSEGSRRTGTNSAWLRSGQMCALFLVLASLTMGFSLTAFAKLNRWKSGLQLEKWRTEGILLMNLDKPLEAI